jgi:hypothetical protein
MKRGITNTAALLALAAGLGSTMRGNMAETRPRREETEAEREAREARNLERLRIKRADGEERIRLAQDKRDRKARARLVSNR